jgi:hypothetical protein
MAEHFKGHDRMTHTVTTRLKRQLKQQLQTAAAVAVVGLALALPATGAMAQNKELNDKSVQTMMQYAWTLMLPKFTNNGKEIIVDLNKPQENMVPVDVAREIIRIGRLSANAQMCGLENEQVANHGTLMSREQAKKKWTDQQMMFINQLHLFTVMLMTGGVKVVAKEGDKDGAKDVVLETPKLNAPKNNVCSDAEKTKVAELLKTYREAGGPGEAAKKP